jgi:hypothetical protein
MRNSAGSQPVLAGKNAVFRVRIARFRQKAEFGLIFGARRLAARGEI